MNEQIEPGDGWRLLGPDEPVFPLDELYFAEGGSWHQMSPQNFLCKAKLWTAVRRKIPALPDVLKIQSEGGSISLETIPRGPAYIIQRWEDSRDEVRLDTTEQIRQVIAWLQQVVDWREQGEQK
jgi:hypothetical protein